MSDRHRDLLVSALDFIACTQVSDGDHQRAILRLRAVQQLAAAAVAGEWERVATIMGQGQRMIHGVRLGFQREKAGHRYVGIACLEERDGMRHHYWLVARDDGAESHVPDDSLTLGDAEIVARAQEDMTG